MSPISSTPPRPALRARRARADLRPRPALRARVALTLLLALVAALLGPALGARADIYRYWGYWQLTSGAWAYAQAGPAQTVPADGSVEGWRFAVDDGSGTRTPRVKPTFEQLCGATAAQAGAKRVGVVVDPGRDVDGESAATPPAPTGTCVSVPTAATGSQVLAAAGNARVEKGLVCAISGYPASGCGGAVATLTEAQKAPDTALALAAATPSPSAVATAAASSSSTSPVGPIVLAVAAVLLVLLIVLAARRRRALGA